MHAGAAFGSSPREIHTSFDSLTLGGSSAASPLVRHDPRGQQSAEETRAKTLVACSNAVFSTAFGPKQP